MNKIDKHFVSEIDKKLAKFDREHPKSAAQQDEIDKYQRIYALRDDPSASFEKDDDSSLWD